MGLKLFWVFVLAVASLIVIDINQHGSFKGSKTDLILKNPQKYIKICFHNFRTNAQHVYRWSQKHIPEYIKQVREGFLPLLLWLRDILVNLAQQVWDNIKTLYHYFLNKKPAVVQWVDHYAPGLTVSVGTWLQYLWTLTCEWSVKLVSLVMMYVLATVQWLRDNVFVGKLSPESLQQLTIAAFNTTQNLATRTLAWFSSKVTTYY